MKQALGPLGQIDAVTSGELKEAMGHHFDEFLRERYRGIKIMKSPIARVSATAAAFTLSQNPNDGAPLGPEQGYIWRVQRVLVASSAITDVAKYVLYAGSDTDTGPVHLLDAVIGGATPGLNVNVAYIPGNRSTWLFPGEQLAAAITGATTGNQYLLSAVVAEVPAEMVGKIQ